MLCRARESGYDVRRMLRDDDDDVHFDADLVIRQQHHRLPALLCGLIYVCLCLQMVVDWLTELLVDVEKAEAAHPTSPRPSVILGRSASTGGPAAAAASAGSGLGFAAADSNPAAAAGSSSGASDVQ